MPSWKHQWDALRWSVHLHGVAGTAATIGAKVARRFGMDITRERWFQSYMARRFDRRFGVETAGELTEDDLDARAASAENGSDYMPTTSALFPLLLTRLGLDYTQYTFVDLGSGKGRVLLMAASFPFRRLIGVELSAELHEIAERNITLYRQRTNRRLACESVCGDAATFAVPEGPIVLYLFNPFTNAVLERVLDNLQQSLSRSPRHVAIVYYKPIFDRTIDATDWLQRWDVDGEFGDDWRVYETRGAPRLADRHRDH